MLIGVRNCCCNFTSKGHGKLQTSAPPISTPKRLLKPRRITRRFGLAGPLGRTRRLIQDSLERSADLTVWASPGGTAAPRTSSNQVSACPPLRSTPPGAPSQHAAPGRVEPPNASRRDRAQSKMANILDMSALAAYSRLMFPLHEIGNAVQTRRSEMGLSQAAVAQLSGLSRSTVNSLESGSIKDLSVNRATKLLGVLGLSFSMPQAHPRVKNSPPRSPALEVAARNANVSYKSQVTAAELCAALVKGEVPHRVFANVRALLEDVPVETLAQVVEQIHSEANLKRSEVWKNMRTLAQQMHVKRDIFE